jgi:hypothetical protein
MSVNYAECCNAECRGAYSAESRLKSFLGTNILALKAKEKKFQNFDFRDQHY